MNTIERLKHNRTAWKWVSAEDKAVFKKVGKENVVFITSQGWADAAHSDFLDGNVYRIYKDYQPEPGYETMKVVAKRGLYGVTGLGFDLCSLSSIACHERIFCFKFADGTLSDDYKRKIYVDGIWTGRWEFVEDVLLRKE